MYCWISWAESQIARCREQRQDVSRCFAQHCAELMCSALWRQLGTRSKQIAAFDSEPGVLQRRRLRANLLYPSELQVDCPVLGCWGLGYLGFDMVQCFICEHQWAPIEGGMAPVDV